MKLRLLKWFLWDLYYRTCLESMQRLIKKFGRKTTTAALIIIIMGAAIAAPFLLGLLLINISYSVPLGLWFVQPGIAQHETGCYVKLYPQNFNHFEKYTTYPFSVGPSGQLLPFIKQVGGIPGDLIEAAAEGILVNGSILPDSQVLSADRANRPLTPFPLPYRLKSGEVWLTSNSARGFDSRYLGPALAAECRKVKPVLVKRIRSGDFYYERYKK